ncbi:hypothetical protein QYM36_011443 [Artemia franciscana]|uniref:ubiquitinyl hydrolase 1 n=1 Tax=Artemia franciscana TaxID=6661 RepID=A0AA88HZ13_ARTSF|nr:hypothetical protein QYM36_011443 [Artemia franciscana]
MTSPTKWKCDYCTFLNWPSSQKCTMCRALRPLRLISPTSSKLDIATESKICSTQDSADKGDDNKWSCGACTYLNWPRSLRCTQCQSPRLNDSDTVINADNIHERIAPLKLTGSPTASRGSPPSSVSKGASPEFEACNTRSNSPQTTSKWKCEHREADWSWLNAIQGVIEGNVTPVASYLNGGGDPLRHLSPADINVLPRYAGVDQGQSLVQIALRYQNEEVLKTILNSIQGTKGTKRTPHHIAPELASDIRKHLSTSLRHHKSGLPCVYFQEMSTFVIPQEVSDLPPLVQSQLYDELLDQDVQKELETDCCAINWSRELTENLGTRLLSLWNRTAGDCLLDSILGATWGILDRDGLMRKSLADCLQNSGHLLYERWAEYEIRTAAEMNLDYIPSEAELSSEWADLVSRARRPGAPLDQLHIWALSHILRRPIIVYGATCVKSHVGEPLDYARFQGVYLPLLWEPSFCWKVPIALGYTRGHFSALVPVEPDNLPSGEIRQDGGQKSSYLPLITNEAQLLPVHFLTEGEIGQEELLLHQWLDVHLTDGGCFVARQRLGRRSLLVAQLMEEWLNYYRRIL